MITRDLGFCRFVVTDSSFGSVAVADPTVVARMADIPIGTFLSSRPSESSNERRDPFPISDRICWMEQTHSDHVQVCSGPEVFPDTDAMITDQTDILLVTRTADCAPLLMWAADRKLVAVVHAGRKGFLKGVVQRTLDKLVELGVDMKELHVFIGPHLRTEHHEVDASIAMDIQADLKDIVLRQIRDSFYFDMTAGIYFVLKSFGVKENNIDNCGIDTYTDLNYFSYRRMKQSNDPALQTNRFASAIMLVA